MCMHMHHLRPTLELRPTGTIVISLKIAWHESVAYLCRAREPMGTRGEAQGNQRGNPREPEEKPIGTRGNPREPEGKPKRTRGETQGNQKGNPREPQGNPWDPQGETRIKFFRKGY